MNTDTIPDAYISKHSTVILIAILCKQSLHRNKIKGILSPRENF